MDFKEYIKELHLLYQVGNTTEHSFRGTLERYLQSLLPKYVVTNEPRRLDCGAPDYVITSKNVPIAFIEAKDINDSDLDGRKDHKEQFNRYKEALNRIIFTNYLDFHLYLEGDFIDSVRIAETRGNQIVGFPENEAKFNEMIISLAAGGRQRITSSSSLARQMAAKAHLLSEAVKKAIEKDGEEGESEISGQLRAFRDVLIHDLKLEEFADFYAQTIVYGMFTARLNDDTPENFSRQEAAELIPRSNPFLRKIFQSIAVYDLDDSIAWIVDDLAAMFAATDAERIMKNYGSNKRHSDPVVHFYEDFLAEYDPKLRKARGVWYTPTPVVKFIVKSVDEILQKEFNLPRGLADDSTIKVDHAIEQSRDRRTTDGMKHEMINVPRVQVLDPATGTGTFLAEVIQQIRDKFNGLEGLWPSYVEKSLIPRIHGFEILMASYTIAHLKLSYTLKETGYTGFSNQRLNVFLTNSLEEATPRVNNLFARWLSDEAYAASKVKVDNPVMICLGNPPYAVSSQNNRKWILDLVADYKKDLNERNIQPLSDDYIKFIRLGQYFIDKNGEGVLAYISNNSFLDGIIHRQMRYQLAQTFDKIYVLNLHGNSRKNEVSPDGGVDENVFDIMQGVSINIFVKSLTSKKRSAEVFYYDIYGSREKKYKFLDSNCISNISWKNLSLCQPYYFFTPKDFSFESKYKNGFALNQLFVLYKAGLVTANDSLFIDFTKQGLIDKIQNEFHSIDEEKIHTISYRPFDKRYVYYDIKKLSRPRYELMRHFIDKENLGIVTSKQFGGGKHFIAYITSGLIEKSSQPCAPYYVYPIWQYNETNRIENVKEDVFEQIKSVIKFDFSLEELIDYIYAVLFCPSYRQTYAEFLNIDFPRIPYPENAKHFHRLREKGSELRELHLMKNSGTWPTTVTFPITGDNIVERTVFTEGKVFINSTQYFGNVSELAWNFFIGGYQPAQKWLKDRKGQTLDYQDIIHYGHIIFALQETDRLVKEIDEIGII